MNETKTVKLRGGAEVLAKEWKWEGKPTLSAKTYANLTQAKKSAEKLGPGWEVIGLHPFYVAKVAP